jgi:hypothetical protein
MLIILSNYVSNREQIVGRESSVGIATRYGFDGPGIESMMDIASVRSHTAADTRKAFKQRIYDALTRMYGAKNGTPELRIVQK